MKRLRLAANLTQEELAERAAVSARLISDLERGVVQRSRRDTVEMLAHGLRLNGTERATFAALASRRQAPDNSADREPAPISLPVQTTAFIGREREISATTSILLQPETRLLTLTGPGGVGKTRLAIETARRAAGAFAGGVTFVDLTPLGAGAMVLPAIARVLSGPDENEPQDLDEMAEAIGDEPLLLVLDNMEHLVDAGPDIAALAERCPQFKLLVTSRQILRLRIEREYRVSPLGLPASTREAQVNALIDAPAVQLFVQRTEMVQPSFTLTDENAGTVAGIVTRLDGLPLAIELAAARMRLLTPAELLQRLNRSLPLLTGGPRDAPDRQRTLQAAIDWSYQILSPEEQQLFRWLSIFTGGFTLDAAEFLSDRMGLSASADTLDTLASLVDKNLVQRLSEPAAGTGIPASRFRMLETIREYSLDRLSQSEERDDVRAHHAEWCAELAAQSDAGLNSPDQAAWQASLVQEHDNFRSALGWAIEMGRSEVALRIAGSLLRFWVNAAQFTEAQRWYEQALALDRDSETAARAKALLGIEVISYFRGDYAAARSYGEEGLRIYQALEDKAGIGWSYGNLGLIADAGEDYERATDLYERALAIFREIGDETHTHFMLGNLGLIAHLQDDQDRATKLLEEALSTSRELGNQNSVAINLSNLGLVAFARGDLDRAIELQTEALELRATADNSGGLAGSFDKIAMIAAAREDYERATRLFAAADAIRTELGTALSPNDRAANSPYIDEAQRALGADRFIAFWEEGVSMPTADTVEYALKRSPVRQGRLLGLHDH